MPPKAKPNNPEIIVLKIALLFLHSDWNFGKIKSTSFFKIWVQSNCMHEFAFYRVTFMVLFLHNRKVSLLYFV